MDVSTGWIALLPFWIIIAGGVLVASTAWFDRRVRQARGRPVDDPTDALEADRADLRGRRDALVTGAAWSTRHDAPVTDAGIPTVRDPIGAAGDWPVRRDPPDADRGPRSPL